MRVYFQSYAAPRSRPRRVVHGVKYPRRTDYNHILLSQRAGSHSQKAKRLERTSRRSIALVLHNMTATLQQNSNRAARSKYALFGLAVGIYDVYTSQTSGIHGARESTLCIRNLCTNVNTDHQGEGLAQSRALFLDKRSIKGLCIW